MAKREETKLSITLHLPSSLKLGPHESNTYGLFEVFTFILHQTLRKDVKTKVDVVGIRRYYSGI
jgi:hypothetical protein